MKITLDFQPRQTVCLEHAGTHLYAEVIQVVVSRQLCWVRPLVLVVFPTGWDQESNESLPLTDLRSCADLLWPLTLFRPALDTEVIGFLVRLLASEPQPDRNPAAQQQLNQFIHQVWQAHLGAF